MNSKTAPFVPKHPDGVLRVVAIGRISTVHQEAESIEASHEYAKKYLDGVYKGPMHLEMLGEQISGMLADRETIRRVEELIDADEVDVIIAEDLGRIYRNPRLQYAFVQDAVDRDIRIICIADNLDTADPNWEVVLSTATVRHGLAVPDARRRVRRTATYSFHKGGMVAKYRYGYRKLSKEEAKSGDFGPTGLRIVKDENCTSVIREMMARLLQGDQYQSIADWLNDEGIDPGPYVECRRWTGRLVSDFLSDPILGGVRTFRDTVCQQIFRTGKHRRKKNSEPETKYYAELAHLTSDEDDALKKEIERRRDAQRCASGADHPRHNLPRCRSIWPGQAATCAICGAMMYQYGAGKLKCRNAFKHDNTRCWNHVQVDCEFTRDRVVSWLIDRISQDPGARLVMIDAAWDELQRVQRRHQQRGVDVAGTIGSLEMQARNLAKAIAKGGQLDALVCELDRVEKAIVEARERQAERALESSEFNAFACREDVAAGLDDAIRSLAATSFEFADLMRRVFPEFVIQPAQALDCGQVRPRAKLKFRPSSLTTADLGSDGAIEETIVLDLFGPPQRISDAIEVRNLLEEAPEIGPKAISDRLGFGVMRAKRARDYARIMQAGGLRDPFRELTEKPATASRWKPRRTR